MQLCIAAQLRAISFRHSAAASHSSHPQVKLVTTHLFEAAVHDLKLFASELCVATQNVQSFRLDSSHVHLYVVQLSI